MTTSFGNAGGESENGVYVLDSSLAVIGSITGLARDESVYAARLMGDTGYFVTFRQTDPLFTVDFSDPRDPRIVGRLKIPGFSEYLHPFGEGLLLGIGMDVEDDGRVTNGVKLSLFDVADPKDVRETDKLVLDGIFWSDALADYRCVFADGGRGIVGFPVSGDDGAEYRCFALGDGTGFREVLSVPFGDEGLWAGPRAVRIGEVLYVANGSVMRSIDLTDFKVAGELKL